LFQLYLHKQVKPQIKRKKRGKNNKHDIIKLKERKKTSNIKVLKYILHKKKDPCDPLLPSYTHGKQVFPSSK
jgi:hypothetical protein